MNVLHVNMSLDPVTGGGTVERVKQLHLAMNEMDEVHSKILAVNVGQSSALEPCDDVILLPCWNRRWYFPALKLRSIYRQIRWADVIHLMNHWTVINVIVYWLARANGTPCVVCPAGALTVFGRSKGLKNWYNRLSGRSMIYRAEAAVAIAADESEVLQHYGVNNSRIYHIPNGICPDDFSYGDGQLFRDYAEIGDAEYMLFFGRLNEIKGPDLLLDAFVRVQEDFPRLHLVFVGPDGGMLEQLRYMAKSAGIGSRVHFSGYAGGELKSSAYHGAALLVVPSRQEAMSIVALEGAVCSIPVIMTDQCGFEALAEAGGALTLEARADALAEAVNLLMSDQDMRVTMGKKGQQFALAEYTWEMAAQRYVELFERVTGGGGG